MLEAAAAGWPGAAAARSATRRSSTPPAGGRTPAAADRRRRPAAAADGAATPRARHALHGPLVARRGLALRLGERSAGHLDPGAVSCLLLLRALGGR